MAPELAGYEGRVIYIDSDMFFQADIWELFEMDMRGKLVARPVHMCCLMVIDAAHPGAREWKYREDFPNHAEGMFRKLVHPHEIYELREWWNVLDHQPPHSVPTKIYHYTDMPRQPWRDKDWPLGHKHRKLFFDLLRDAVRTGFISPALVAEEVQKGHVIPQVLDEIAEVAA